MNPLLETIIEKGLVLDSFGIIGLGLVGLAALKLARTYQSWGGKMMAGGAISLLLARLYFLVAPHVLDTDLFLAIGSIGRLLMYAMPPLLLTFGLAWVVWGLWGHERWLREENR